MAPTKAAQLGEATAAGGSDTESDDDAADGGADAQDQAVLPSTDGGLDVTMPRPPPLTVPNDSCNSFTSHPSFDVLSATSSVVQPPTLVTPPSPGAEDGEDGDGDVVDDAARRSERALAALNARKYSYASLDEHMLALSLRRSIRRRDWPNVCSHLLTHSHYLPSHTFSHLLTPSIRLAERVLQTHTQCTRALPTPCSRPTHSARPPRVHFLSVHC